MTKKSRDVINFFMNSIEATIFATYSRVFSALCVPAVAPFDLLSEQWKTTILYRNNL
jgi:hypothetical protein